MQSTCPVHRASFRLQLFVSSFEAVLTSLSPKLSGEMALDATQHSPSHGSLGSLAKYITHHWCLRTHQTTLKNTKPKKNDPLKSKIQESERNETAKKT